MQERQADNIGVHDGTCTDGDRFCVARATETQIESDLID